MLALLEHHETAERGRHNQPSEGTDHLAALGPVTLYLKNKQIQFRERIRVK